MTAEGAPPASEFKPGYSDLVRFRTGPDIEGIVTATLVNQNGEAKSAWFRTCELLPSAPPAAKGPGQ